MSASLLLALPFFLLEHLCPSHFEHVIIFLLLQSPLWHFYSFLLKPVRPHCFLPPHDFIGNIQYTTQQMEVVWSAGYVFFRSQPGSSRGTQDLRGTESGSSFSAERKSAACWIKTAPLSPFNLFSLLACCVRRSPHRRILNFREFLDWLKRFSETVN